jgi:hypothetical protein
MSTPKQKSWYRTSTGQLYITSGASHPSIVAPLAAAVLPQACLGSFPRGVARDRAEGRDRESLAWGRASRPHGTVLKARPRTEQEQGAIGVSHLKTPGVTVVFECFGGHQLEFVKILKQTSHAP